MYLVATEAIDDFTIAGHAETSDRLVGRSVGSEGHHQEAWESRSRRENTSIQPRIICEANKLNDAHIKYLKWGRNYSSIVSDAAIPLNIGFSLGERSSNRTALSISTKFYQQYNIELGKNSRLDKNIFGESLMKVKWNLKQKLLTPFGISVMNGAKLVWTGAPWPGVIVPQAAVGAPPGDP